MSQRLKSSLYFASFVIACTLYYIEINVDQNPQTVEMATAEVEQVTAIGTLD